MKVLGQRKRRKSTLKIGINAVLIDKTAYVERVKKEWGRLVDHINIELLMGRNSLPRTSTCRTLWRNLVVTWDGSVVPCCVDMENKLLIGNAKEKTLKDIFNDLPVQHLRKKHLERRYPEICKYCDSYFG